jgi:uncharacterized RDD family membrane protein YckC
MENLDENVLNFDGTRMEHASVGSRIGASLLDLLVMSPITIGLNFYNYMSLKSLPIALGILAIGSLYKPLLEYFKGATPGKMMLGLSVTDQNYEKMSMDQSFLRSLPFYLGTLATIPLTLEIFSAEDFKDVTSFMDYSAYVVEKTKEHAYTNYVNYASTAFMVISLIMVISDKKRVALHDMLAKTYVVKK